MNRLADDSRTARHSTARRGQPPDCDPDGQLVVQGDQSLPLITARQVRIDERGDSIGGECDALAAETLVMTERNHDKAGHSVRLLTLAAHSVAPGRAGETQRSPARTCRRPIVRQGAWSGGPGDGRGGEAEVAWGLADASDGVGKRVLPERKVDADPLAAPEEVLLKVRSHAVEHSTSYLSGGHSLAAARVEISSMMRWSWVAKAG